MDRMSENSLFLDFHVVSPLILTLEFLNFVFPYSLWTIDNIYMIWII